MSNILEAIKKGVQLGLEIQDDEQGGSVFQGSQITSDYHANRADQLRWLRDNFVDLGLPSGTLWCKWNLGATNGDTPKSWYGNYYAWGEVEIKETCGRSTYKHYSRKDGLTKYTGDDGKANLDPEDDAASVTLGKGFRMPTKEDTEELCSLPNEWVKDYNGINGLNGRIFTGNNGNQLFIPAAGFRPGFDKDGVGSYCGVWSSSLNLDNLNYAYYLNFNPSNISSHYSSYRCTGHSVRAVI